MHIKNITLHNLINKLRNDLRTPNIWPENMSKEDNVKINELDRLLVDFIARRL